MPGAELSWDQIEATQNAANKQAGPRYVPGRSIPVPNTVSPSLQTSIAAAYRTPAWDANPKDTADWKTLIGTLGDETAAATREMQEKLGVTIEPTVSIHPDAESDSARESESPSREYSWRWVRL